MAEHHANQECCDSGHSLEAVSEVKTHDDCCGHSHDASAFNLEKKLKLIAIATSLLLVGLIFHNALHQTPFALAEYAVLIPAYLLCGWGVLTTAGRNILRRRILWAYLNC